MHIIEPENPIILRKIIKSIFNSSNIIYPNNQKVIVEKYLRENQSKIFLKVVKDRLMLN